MKAAIGATLCACLLSAGLPAARLAAQGPSLHIVPKVGMSMPLGTLADNTEIDFAVAFGAAGELVLPRLPFSVRASVDYAREANITQRTSTEPVLGQASILALAGDVVIRPLPATAIAQPYFLGGGGVRRYDIRIGPVADTQLRSGTTTRAALHFGGGFDVLLGPLSLVLEVTDYLGTFPDGSGGTRLQNDVFAMIGLRVALF
jgi:hypothetical protein